MCGTHTPHTTALAFYSGTVQHHTAKRTDSDRLPALHHACAAALAPDDFGSPPSLAFRSMSASSRVCRSHSCTSPTGTYEDVHKCFTC